MKRNLGMSAREKKVVELAALTVKVALDDLPNNPELCAGIVQSAALWAQARQAAKPKPWWHRLLARTIKGEMGL